MRPGNFLTGGVLLVGVLISATLTSANAAAAEFRILSGFEDPFSDARLLAMAFRLAEGRILRADRLELSAGGFISGSEIRPMISLGPVWRARGVGEGKDWFYELGFAPMLMSSREIGGKDSGSSFHFTTSVAFGRSFGRNKALNLGLRYQHSSNGKLRKDNPGIDLLGITVSYSPGNTQ